MFKLRWFFVALFAAAYAPLEAADDLNWWKTAVFYQVYPLSFKDSNGDGTGDLPGITSKLDHLKELGVEAVWLSPIFASPMVDFGYDVSDFIAIDPLFGTMDDFDALVQKAKDLDIKVVLDFVPNHSSDQHAWFKRALLDDATYKDYFVWRSSRGTNETGSPIPPNDWVGSFLQSVWTFESFLGEFFYHRFNNQQPDLNYRSEALREDMKNVLRFWLDKGVHGFRVDSIQVLVEDERFPDVPSSDSDLYCLNQPLTYEVVREWRGLLDEYTAKDNVTRVMILEAFGKQEELLGYYGNTTHPGAHFVFNFEFIFTITNQSKAQDYVNTINEWMDNLPENSASNWVIGNHDTSRVASRFGSDLAAGVAMLALLLPGIGIVYNGEEIGMVNNMDISYEDTLDPLGVNAGPDGYLQASRDFERTPFQWDATKDAGFSTANKTWLPVHANYEALNLALEKGEPSSYFNTYKRLMAARKSDSIKTGSLVSVAVSEHVVAVARELEASESYLVVINVGTNAESVDLNAAFGQTFPPMTVYAVNVAANLAVNEPVDASSLLLQPMASVVLSSSAGEMSP